MEGNNGEENITFAIALENNKRETIVRRRPRLWGQKKAKHTSMSPPKPQVRQLWSTASNSVRDWLFCVAFVLQRPVLVCIQSLSNKRHHQTVVDRKAQHSTKSKTSPNKKTKRSGSSFFIYYSFNPHAVVNRKWIAVQHIVCSIETNPMPLHLTYCGAVGWKSANRRKCC